MESVRCPCCEEAHDAIRVTPDVVIACCPRGYSGPLGPGITQVVGVPDRDYFDAIAETHADPVRAVAPEETLARWAL